VRDGAAVHHGEVTGGDVAASALRSGGRGRRQLLGVALLALALALVGVAGCQAQLRGLVADIEAAPATVSAALDVRYEVRRDGTVAVEERLTYDLVPDARDGFDRTVARSWTDRDGTAIIHDVGAVRAARVVGDEELPAPVETAVQADRVTWFVGERAARLTEPQQRTWVLRYDLEQPFLERPDGLLLGWQIHGRHTTGGLSGITVTVEGDGVVAASCDGCGPMAQRDGRFEGRIADPRFGRRLELRVTADPAVVRADPATPSRTPEDR
jgi:hypothetical protein